MRLQKRELLTADAVDEILPLVGFDARRGLRYAKERNAVLAGQSLGRILEPARLARHVGDRMAALEEPDTRREVQLAARETGKGIVQVDCQLENIIPGTDEKEVIPARIDDVDLARLLLRRAEQRELLVFPLANAVDLAAAQRVDAVLEEERELTGQRGDARQRRVRCRKACQESRAEVIDIRAQDAEARDAPPIDQPPRSKRQVLEVQHVAALIAGHIIAHPEMRRQSLACQGFILDVETRERTLPALHISQRLRRQEYIALLAGQRYRRLPLLRPDT